MVFVQRFGNDDLFTGVPPESLWGWRRNVGLLVAILNRRKIRWKERYAQNLSDVQEDADLFVLRDWRYDSEEVFRFITRHRDSPVIAMLFQGPQYCLEHQRVGEGSALFGSTRPDVDQRLAKFEAGLFATDRVVVRSRLNADLFAQLGYPREKMVLLPHAPVWMLKRRGICPAELPGSNFPTGRQGGFDLLFVGESLLRKGVFRLYRAFSSLSIPGKRLHIYNRGLYNCLKGATVDFPDYMLPFVQQILHDPVVHIHKPYRGISGCIQAHRDIDLMVCPSLLDCGPNVIVEAYQLGTPVLASTLCGAVHDLPAGAVWRVSAPEWWRDREPASAYTERLAASIADFRAGHRVVAHFFRPDTSHILETIVGTWERLLDEYL